MGTYVYTFRKRTSNVVIDGEVQKVHAFAYAHKPSYSAYIDPRVMAAQDRQIEMAHDAFEECTPVEEKDGEFVSIFPFVYVGDKPSEGCEVYRAKSGVWSDHRDFPGEFVGRLTKVGNRWQCVAEKAVA